MDNNKTWTRLSVEESIRMREDRDEWRKYVHGVANPWTEDGERTEQNRTGGSEVKPKGPRAGWRFGGDSQPPPHQLRGMGELWVTLVVPTAGFWTVSRMLNGFLAFYRCC